MINNKPTKEELRILRKVNERLTEKNIYTTPIENTLLLITINQGLEKYKNDKDYSEDSFVGMLVWAVQKGGAL